MRFIKNPDFRRIEQVSKAVPRKILKDSDMDTVPDFLDCQPFNPRKQGEIVDYTIDTDTGSSYVTEAGIDPPRKQGIGDRLRNWGNRYKAWKQESEQKGLKRLQYKTEKAGLQYKLESIRNQRAQGRLNLQKQRLSLMRERQRAIGPMPSMFGSSMFRQEPLLKKEVRRKRAKRRSYNRQYRKRR